jgi:hypothetical protein
VQSIGDLAHELFADAILEQRLGINLKGMMDGWMYVCMHGWMDACMDGRAARGQISDWFLTTTKKIITDEQKM